MYYLTDSLTHFARPTLKAGGQLLYPPLPPPSSTHVCACIALRCVGATPWVTHSRRERERARGREAAEHLDGLLDGPVVSCAGRDGTDQAALKVTGEVRLMIATIQLCVVVRCACRGCGYRGPLLCAKMSLRVLGVQNARTAYWPTDACIWKESQGIVSSPFFFLGSMLKTH